VIEALLQADRLLLMGMLDEAEALYRRSAESDPHSAMAVVGLARVALERGDEKAAYALACDALAIDVDDAVALRMEARLSEVLAARGESVSRPPFVASAAATVKTATAPAPAPGPDISELAARAERAAASRNPSMADHRERVRPAEDAPGESPPGLAASDADEPEPAPRRKALLRRILGR
jgi:hypothetical protein